MVIGIVLIPVTEISIKSLGCVGQDAPTLTFGDHVGLLLTYSMILDVHLLLKPIEVVVG